MASITFSCKTALEHFTSEAEFRSDQAVELGYEAVDCDNLACLVDVLAANQPQPVIGFWSDPQPLHFPLTIEFDAALQSYVDDIINALTGDDDYHEFAEALIKAAFVKG